ncbi:hypothetical protein [Paracoccus sp. IB05]|uniref:hypothetical protein n=1 Tax=Paracoccus sp. IB05 TaxID=2779367 RepID=UPI0018E7CC8A|nr:hypothetical protein [Paracoccus sp. IB05]MBJ2149551.1 hypothetical protein [Paracoccus sp. IB05]
MPVTIDLPALGRSRILAVILVQAFAKVGIRTGALPREDTSSIHQDRRARSGRRLSHQVSSSCLGMGPDQTESVQKRGQKPAHRDDAQGLAVGQHRMICDNTIFLAPRRRLKTAGRGASERLAPRALTPFCGWAWAGFVLSCSLATVWPPYCRAAALLGGAFCEGFGPPPGPMPVQWA